MRVLFAAMGIRPYFDAVVSAQDSEVRRFKPHPRGLEVTLARLGVEPGQACYIGDRPEVDAAAARAAGLECVIFDEKNKEEPKGATTPASYRRISHCAELQLLPWANS